MKKCCLYTGTLLFIVAGLFSCRPKESPSADNDIKFDTIHSVRNYHLDNDSTQPSCNLKISFVYPSEYKDPTVLKSLQDIFTSCYFDESYAGLSPENAIKKYEDYYVERYKEDARIFSRDNYEHDGSETYSSYYEIDSNVITFNKGGILSFQTNQTNYKGGADSYELIRNYSIDIKNAKLIMEDDLFNEGYDKVFNTIFRDYLLQTHKVKTVYDLENLGYFGIEEMTPNGNFMLDDKGITYIFNKGEYSGYKVNPIKISINYKDIKPLIKEESVVSKFLPL